MQSYSSEDIPAIPPPPGVISNFVDPETRAPLVIVFTSICLALMWPILIARIYSKTWILRSFGWDDLSAIAAAMITTIQASAVIWGAVWFTFTPKNSYAQTDTDMRLAGPHGYDIRAIDVTNKFAEINAVVVDFFYGPAAFFAKLSIFLLYLRTFAPNQWMRRLTHCGIAINLIFYAGIALAFGISCIGPSQDSINSRCRQVTKPLKYIVSIFGAISNLYIYILPLPVIWHLQMTFRRKVGVSVIFAIGIFAIAASILGVYYRILDAIDPDPFWPLPPVLLVAIVELSIEVICGCMPFLACLFRHQNNNVSLLWPVRFFLAWYRSRFSKSEKDVDVRKFECIGSATLDNRIRAETQINMSIQSINESMQTNSFDNQWSQTWRANEPTQQTKECLRNVLE